jgi:hypothetical protein
MALYLVKHKDNFTLPVHKVYVSTNKAAVAISRKPSSQ